MSSFTTMERNRTTLPEDFAARYSCKRQQTNHFTQYYQVWTLYASYSCVANTLSPSSPAPLPGRPGRRGQESIRMCGAPKLIEKFISPEVE